MGGWAFHGFFIAALKSVVAFLGTDGKMNRQDRSILTVLPTWLKRAREDSANSWGSISNCQPLHRSKTFMFKSYILLSKRSNQGNHALHALLISFQRHLAGCCWTRWTLGLDPAGQILSSHLQTYEVALYQVTLLAHLTCCRLLWLAAIP